MQINKINNTNFQGIYRIKNTPAIVTEIQNKVIPSYHMVSNNPIVTFVGKNPFKIALDELMAIVANAQNCSKEWLAMNANNHGLNLSAEKIGDDCLHIITGEKDIKNISEYMYERTNKLKPTFKDKVMKFFGISKEVDYGIKENTPEHLVPLFIALSKNEDEDIAFAEFTGKRVIKVNTPQELLTRMLMER